jgi:hypothetical protein
LEAAAKRVAERFSGDAGIAGGVDKFAKVIDKITDNADKAGDHEASRSPSDVITGKHGDTLGRLVGYLRGGSTGIAGGNPFGAITDFIKKAATDPAALQEKKKPEPKSDAAKAGDTLGGFATSSAAREMQQSAQLTSKAADDHVKAASDLSKAASDLSSAAKSSETSKAAGDLSKAAASSEKAAGAKAGEDGVAGPVGARGIVEDLTTHSGVHPDTQVSGDGSRADDIYDLNKMLSDQKAVGEYEGDKNNEFSKSIREQLGLPTDNNKQHGVVPHPNGGKADLSERLDDGSYRYRYNPDSNYQPAEVGTYDENMNFHANKRQPYGRLREKPFASDRPYSPLEDTFDTKGGGDNSPIHHYGQPQPMDFPGYTRSLREELMRPPLIQPGVPLPQPDPRTPGPQSALEQPQQIASLSSAVQDFLANVSAALTRQKGTNITDPQSGGIRGEGGAIGDGATGKLADLGTAAEDAAAKLRGIEAPAKLRGVDAPAAATEAPASATEAPVALAATGGHIRGPGTATSDSIPAMLSDGEYVVKADAVSRVGVDRLDDLNRGVAHFADGGNVSANSTTLQTGQHQITATQDGGAIIDGVKYPYGSPILQDPVVQEQIKKSLAGAKDGSDKPKHKSDFVGIFGGHVFDTEGSYAKGGLVKHFAAGGLVGGASSGPSRLASIIKGFANGGIIDIPHFAVGGMPDIPTADLSKSSAFDKPAASAMEHWGTIDMRSDHGDFKVATERDTMRHLSSSAQKAKRFSTGPKPGWFGGNAR